MARNFDGINDYLDAGNPSALDITGDEVTLSAWMRLFLQLQFSEKIAQSNFMFSLYQ